MNYFQNIINKNVKRINILRNGMLNSNSPKYTGKLDDLKLPLKDHSNESYRSTLNFYLNLNNINKNTIIYFYL